MCAKNTKTNTDSSESRIESLYTPASRLAESREGSVLFGDDSNYGARVLLTETDRVPSGGVVAMAAAAASEWLPVTTSWWFNEFIMEFQRKTGEWMSSCSALKVPKSIAGRAVSVREARADTQASDARQACQGEGIHAWTCSHVACEGLSACYSESVRESRESLL